MLRIVIAILTGLIGAALLHLVIVLALPHFTGQDAYTRVMAEGPAHRFYQLGIRQGSSGLANDDPFIRAAVCAFEVDELPVRLTAAGAVPFWSLAVYDSASNEVFSMNDRTAVDGVLDVLLVSPVQLNAIRKALPETLAETILVETRVPGGYAVLRTLVPQPSFQDKAAGFLAEAGCAPFEWR